MINQQYEQVPFQIKIKKNGHFKKTHYIISTYVDLMENDANAFMNQPTRNT